MRKLYLGALFSLALLSNAEANITVNSPITFGSEFSVGSGAVVHIENGGITNAMLQNSGITINGSFVALGGSITISALGCSGVTDGGVLYWASGSCTNNPAQFNWDGNALTVTGDGSGVPSFAGTFVGGLAGGGHKAIRIGDSTGTLSTDALYLGVDSGGHQGVIQMNNNQSISIMPSGFGVLYAVCTAQWDDPSTAGMSVCGADTGSLFGSGFRVRFGNHPNAFISTANPSGPNVMSYFLGDVRLGDWGLSSLAATTGFPSMVTSAGIPTGTPTNTVAGQAQFEYDTTNHVLNIYDQPTASWYHIALSPGAG